MDGWIYELYSSLVKALTTTKAQGKLSSVIAVEYLTPPVLHSDLWRRIVVATTPTTKLIGQRAKNPAIMESKWIFLPLICTQTSKTSLKEGD